MPPDSGVDIGFYHCTRQPSETVAVKLAARAFSARQRLLIVGNTEQLQALDDALWAEEGFLAHGMAGGANDRDQPILLGQTPDAANGAQLLMLLQTGLPADFAGFNRVLNLFDDGSAAHARARADWKAIASRDSVQRSYWQQKAEGGWAKKS